MIELSTEPNPIGDDRVVKYVKLQTGYYLDPAVANLSDVAELAFVRSIAYCGAAETHGFVPAAVLPSIVRRISVRATSKVCQELVTATLWIPVDGGFRLRTWDDNQDSVETLLSRRKSERERQRKHRNKGVDDPVDEPEMSRDIERDLTRAREDQTREELKHLTPLVRRQLFGDARKATTTDTELEWLWATECAPADLATELRAWLLHNAERDLRNPSAALLGWLRSAAKRGQLVVVPGCQLCIRGWIADEFGQPSERRCSSCRPGLQAVAGEA